MNLEEQIKKLISLLTEEDLAKDILKISPDRKPVIEFLNSKGELSVSYTNTEPPRPGYFQEVGGNVSLWNYDNDEWTILVYQLKKFFPELIIK